jgi:DNA repair protein RadC
MLVEISEENNRVNINSAEVAYKIFLAVLQMQDELDQDKEHMIVIGIKRNNRIKFIDIVSVGTLVGTLVGAREIFRRAIHTATHAIIIAHNHPSGSHSPSSSDIAITKTLKEAGKIIDIQLLDHIVFSTDGYYSFANEGTL